MIRVAIAAARSAPRSEPTNNQELTGAAPGGGNGAAIWRFALIAAPMVAVVLPPKPKDVTEQQMDFARATVVPDPGTRPGLVRSAGDGAIVIEFAAGAWMRITGAVDAATRMAVVAALADGRPR